MPKSQVRLKAEAKEVLDELWAQKLIPFALSVGELTEGVDEYKIHFHDSRIRTARIPMNKNSSFKEMVREAVLARVAQISGPLQKPIRRQLD